MKADIKAMALMTPVSIVFLVKALFEKADHLMIAYLSIMIIAGIYSAIKWVKK